MWYLCDICHLQMSPETKNVVLNQYWSFKRLSCPSRFRKGTIRSISSALYFYLFQGEQMQIFLHSAVMSMSQCCVDLNRYTDSQLCQRQRPRRFVATKATICFFFLIPLFFFFFSCKRIDVFFCSARGQYKERGWIYYSSTVKAP